MAYERTLTTYHRHNKAARNLTFPEYVRLSVNLSAIKNKYDFIDMLTCNLNTCAV
jgi:hypothetical protein